MIFRLPLVLERSFDRFQNLGSECEKLWNPICAVCDCAQAVWVVNCIIYETNCIVMCMCKTQENFNFLKKGKIVILVKNPKFIL